MNTQKVKEENVVKIRERFIISNIALMGYKLTAYFNTVGGSQPATGIAQRHFVFLLLLFIDTYLTFDKGQQLKK